MDSRDDCLKQDILFGDDNFYQKYILKELQYNDLSICEHCQQMADLSD